jgi:plasmid stabilization system protein ParE
VKGYRLNTDAESDVEEAFELLAENPGIGHQREDLTARPVKSWSVFSYIVIYRPEKRPIDVLAVLHDARDIPRVLAERVN